MSWADPQALWLLALLPLAVAALMWSEARRRRATEQFGKAGTIDPLITGRARWWRATRATLMIVGVALAIVAFAGPQYGSRTRVLRKRGIDIVIALDFSKSMLAKDVHPSRITRAKAELEAAGIKTAVFSMGDSDLSGLPDVEYVNSHRTRRQILGG